MAVDTNDTPTAHLETAGEQIEHARELVNSDSVLDADLAALHAEIEALLDRFEDTLATESEGDDDDQDDPPRIPTPGGLRAL